MSNLDLEKIIFPNDNNIYIIRDAQAHTDLANKADKDGSNIVGPWTMNIIGHASQDIASTEKRQPGGVAELDQNAKIITSQLPSSVDEIIEGYYFNNKFYEDAQHTKEITGEASKIYIDLSSNQTYRWSGSTYVEISPSIALGVEHSTAGYGDWTNTAYLHAIDANKISAAVASRLYKIAATSEGHIASLTAVTKADITALGIPAQDTTYSQGTGISIDNNNVINHSNSVTAGTAKGDDSKTLTFGGTFTIPSITYDAQGHITTKGTTTMTMPGNPNTDRYVNSASFAHDSTNDNVKMTLTRAGSDTATVTANIPKVSSSSSGVVPKGATVSSQSQTTKFLREDGTWAKPSYTTNTNTTYTLGTSGNTVILTPSSGSVQSITVPFATNSTKATQDASGNTITTTYRRLDNNTFDTISVTDLTAGDVVVTGVGRFTNGLYGNLTGNADTATKATQDGNGNVITSSYTPYKGNMSTAIGQNTSAAATKTYWESNTNIPTTSVNTAYNSSGTEYTLLFSKGGTNNYGSILRLGYSTPYLEILRRYQGKWQSTDWEKISAGYADTADSATKATQDGSGNVITSTYLPLKTAGGIAYCSANGANNYFQIATITIGATYVNYPIVFELSGRGHAFTKLSVMFTNVNNTDPGLKEFITDGYDQYWIKKTATSTWVLYGKYSEVWGGETLHRISGMGFNKVTVTVDMTNYGTTAPIDATQVTYGWNCNYADTATTASKLGSSNVGSATQPIYLSAGTATACTYSLNKTVPSDAVFTDTKNTAGSTDTSSKIFLIGATSQAANPQTYSDDQVYVTSGTLQANSISATTNVIGVTLGVNSSTGTTGGISLYGGAGNVDNYGIAFRLTSNKGVHGYVQSNWATYFTMFADSGDVSRGWIFKDRSGNTASISGGGNAVFNGSVTVGGNAANTSGVRQVYNSTTKSLDFVFVA